MEQGPARYSPIDREGERINNLLKVLAELLARPGMIEGIARLNKLNKQSEGGMTMKNYQGKRTAGGPRVIVTDLGLSSPLKHVVMHSPTGMEWGYCGSGPADLALSILTDAVGPQKALLYHQEFKAEFIAGLGDEWLISAADVKRWVAGKEPKL